MIRSILVPLDGSVFGEHALPLALDLARKAKVTIHLAQVLLPAGSMGPEAPLVADSVLLRRLAEQQKAVQQHYLDTIARQLTTAGAPRVQTWLLDGEIAGMIRRQAETVATDLVVMSTHGRGRFARFWLGSVADELIRTVRIPLLLVRPGEEPPDLEKPPPLKHFLLPLDGSPLSQQIIGPAVSLGTLTEADYTLLRVLRPVLPQTFSIEGQAFGEMAADSIRQAEEQFARNGTDAEAYLNRVAAEMREAGRAVLTRVEVDESPVTAILRHAKSVDVVAVATHGRKGLSRLFLGSVADKLVRGASVPVLLYRPKEA